MSMSIRLKYGRSYVDLDFDQSQRFTIIQPPDVPGVNDPLAEVRKAIQVPVTPCTRKFTSGKTVAIAINDKTRPVPHEYLLPPLLEYLHQNGIPNKNITFIFATGTHSPMAKDEYFRVLPEEILHNYQVICHNCDDAGNLIPLGKTTYGTPISINRQFYQADIKIVVGNIEPHHFMGFSGGVKTAGIGLASRKTINANHAHLVQPEARIGDFYSNPCRIDLEEIGGKIGIDFALNAILNTKREIVHVLWGNPLDVMTAGIELSTRICQVEVPQRFDIVIASAGGYPKDINLYQSQKALTNAAEITKDCGDVYLVAACDDGPGNLAFVNFLEGVKTPQEVLSKFSQQGFSVGPHKAFQIARIASRVNIHLISNMETSLVNNLLFDPLTVDKLKLLISQLPNDINIAILPHGVATIPRVKLE